MVKKIVCRDINGGMREAAASELSFRPSVYGVIIKNNSVLLVPQWDGYDFPGGGVELGETVDEALVREVLEETGLVVARSKVLACESDFFIHPFTKKPLHSILAYFACAVVSGEISDEGFDADEKEYAKKAEWISLDRIDKLKFKNSVDSAAIIKKAMI